MKKTDAQMFCKDCGHERPLSDFYRVKDARAAGGYRYGPYCKTHTNARTAESRRKAPEGSSARESMRRASRKYAAEHKEATRERVARHRARKKGDAGEAS
jgi:ribosomal protein L44E